jgi:hypothetical protein
MYARRRSQQGPRIQMPQLRIERLSPTIKRLVRNGLSLEIPRQSQVFTEKVCILHNVQHLQVIVYPKCLCTRTDTGAHS